MSTVPSTKILLFALLLPIYSFGGSRGERQKQLKEMSFTKAKELKELGKQISDASEFITSLGSKYELLMEIALHRKIGDSKLSDFEKSQVKAEIERTNNALCDDMICALCEHGGFDHSLATKLFDQQEMVSPYRFDSLKFLYIRAAAEYYLLTQLVDRYEVCLRESLEINRELSILG